MGLIVRRSCGAWLPWRVRAGWARSRSGWRLTLWRSQGARCGGGCVRLSRGDPAV